MRLVGLLGSIRLPKGYAEALESFNLTKTTKKIAGRVKTSFYDTTGDLYATVTEAADGRKITKVKIPKANDPRYNGPAEEVLRMIGVDMKPRTKAQEELQQRFFRTADANTGRLQNGLDVEVVKPNGDSTQYFYERGVYAASPYYWGKYKPEAYLDSAYNISGKLTHKGGKGACYNDWLLEDVRIVDQETGMGRNIKKPHEYTEWADD